MTGSDVDSAFMKLIDMILQRNLGLPFTSSHSKHERSQYSFLAVIPSTSRGRLVYLVLVPKARFCLSVTLSEKA